MNAADTFETSRLIALALEKSRDGSEYSEIGILDLERIENSIARCGDPEQRLYLVKQWARTVMRLEGVK